MTTSRPAALISRSSTTWLRGPADNPKVMLRTVDHAIPLLLHHSFRVVPRDRMAPAITSCRIAPGRNMVFWNDIWFPRLYGYRGVAVWRDTNKHPYGCFVSGELSQMGVSERIRQAASDKGMTLKDFSSALGISYRTVQNYVAEERAVGAEFLAAASERLGISATWLLTGQGAISLPEKHSIEGGTPPAFVPIPRFAVEASAGHGALVHDEDGSGYYAFNRKFLERRGLNPNKLAVISVRGDSMEPELYDGDLILLDMAETTPRDSRIYAVRYNADLFVKRVMELPGNRIQLLSTNPHYPPITVDAPDLDGIRIIGRVVNSTHEW